MSGGVRRKGSEGEVENNVREEGKREGGEGEVKMSGGRVTLLYEVWEMRCFS